MGGFAIALICGGPSVHSVGEKATDNDLHVPHCGHLGTDTDDGGPSAFVSGFDLGVALYDWHHRHNTVDALQGGGVVEGERSQAADDGARHSIAVVEQRVTT